MALVLADRVRETTAVVGTGTATLLGAITGFQSFAAVGNANTTYYTITHQNANEWEVGIGTYTSSGTTLSRDTVLSSSNGGSLVNFSAGTKDVWVDYSAEKAVTTDTLAYPPAIGGTTPNAGTFTTLTATGQTELGGSGSSAGLRVSPFASSDSPWILTAGRSGVQGARFTALSPSIQSTDSAPVDLRTNAGTLSGGTGTTQFRVGHTTNAVNFVQVTGAATGGLPTVSAQGSDTNVAMFVTSKGNGTIRLATNNATNTQLRVTHTTSSVNFLNATGSIAGSAPVLSVDGNDTNVSMALESKGTGAINLAPGSSGVNISNGGTVTAITRTALGGGYTSIPSITISPPTTAGGVQATASVSSMFTNTATVQSGGTGYTVGNVLTVVGGTAFGGAATYTVTGVSGGAVTSVTPLNFNQYSVLPANPVSTTGGTGSGATLNLTYGIGTVAFTITNAGSGYVEQPTVTFSGGGGSGAAAYATVGSGTTVRSLGSTMSFVTPGGISTSQPSFQIAEAGAGVSNYLKAIGASGVPYLQADGAATNISTAISSKGTGSVSFFTNSANQSQMVVAHTASAVNFVQVTGAATGVPINLSSQGSDANIGMLLRVKGSPTGPGFRIENNNGANVCFAVTTSGANVVNYLRVDPAAAGSAAGMSAQGNDTNIDLALTPKGTGLVRFGTYTASMALTVQGFIEVKDSGGTIRKLAVIA
jgi:hypothetical protein